MGVGDDATGEALGRDRTTASGGKPLLFLTRRIPEPGPTLLRDSLTLRGGEEDRDLTPVELLEGVRGVAAVLCTLRERIDDAVLDAAGPSLRVVSNFAVGYDNIDVAAATARGVLVTNTPGVLTEATADLAWALILAAARRVPEGDRMVRSGAFHGWAPTMLLGVDVAGATLGIVGMGQIGRAVARRAVGFSMPVVYTRRSGPLEATETPAGAEWRYCSDLDSLLVQADIISVHVPLTEGTHHLLGARELALVRPGAVLVNTARGPVVHEEALVEALRGGPLGAAGLDVYEDEPAVHPGLAGLENVVLLPHLGSATHAARGRMAELAARNAIAALSGARVPHPVNLEALGSPDR